MKHLSLILLHLITCLPVATVNVTGNGNGSKQGAKVLNNLVTGLEPIHGNSL